jgi:hypothetical protein
MAELTFKSPGVSTREIDLTGPTAIQPVGIPAGIVSPTEKGPAFVPSIIATDTDYSVVFGNPTTNLKLGSLSATEWLRTQQSVLQLRVLGVGDGAKRTTSGNNRGKVTSAGFVVGDRQPQSTLSGALGNNTYANSASVSPSATGSVGRTFFLGTYMSQSSGSTFFTDSGLSGQGVPVLRGVLFAASGVIITLSASNVPTSSPPSSSQAASWAAGTVHGFYTGSLNMSSSLQEFVLLLNGHKGTDATYPNVVTASFDINAPNYLGTVLNKDPLKMEQAGHLLYSYYDIHPSIATPTGSGIIVAASGAGATSTTLENIVFCITGSQTVNSGTATAPNFECFEDRFRTPCTPWFTSQLFGGKPQNLFKVWALSDGEWGNNKLKISIENISPANTDTTPYGTFDLLVRDFNDTDNNKVVLEQWRGLSINPSSDRYIGRIIGDYNTYYNFDTDASSQMLVTLGEFPNQSRYIRVELADSVKSGEIDGSALPIGFRGPSHLMTSGSAPFNAYTDSSQLQSTNPFYKVVQPPVPMRKNLAKGVGTTKTADKSLYWGVQFEQVISVSESNASIIPNRSMPSFTKYFPSFQLDWQNFSVKDNEGTLDTAANGIIDCDRFNNNMFSLERVQIKYSSTTNLPDLVNLKDWSYVRSGSIPTDTTNLTRALAVSDLLDPSVRSIAKFTVFMEGGFNGNRIFDSSCTYMTNNAVVEEMNNQNRGYSSGPTVQAYNTAINIMKDNSEVDIQLFIMPGIRHRYLTDTALLAMENDRFDCFYIMDIEERDVTNAPVTDPTTQNVSVRYTSADFRNRGLNSSFGAAYFPDVNIKDTTNRTIERVPPSVAVLGAFGKNDALGHPWFAPAGFTRGTMNSVEDATLLLSRANMDDLQTNNINPIVAFAGQGPTVYGQKTLLASESALDRVNVRRMLLSIRREVKKVSNQIMFEPLRESTLASFQALVNPILKRVQDLGGLENFRVLIDTSTTSQLDIENKTIRGKIFVVPTKTLEFMSLDFVLTNRGNFISG